MRNRLAALVLAAAAAFGGPAHAQRDASAASALSALPVASVVAGASAAALPVVLSSAGTVLVVKGAEASARGTVYLLERASDGARVSIEILGRGASEASIAAGTLVTVSVIGSGVVLSTAAEMIAFIPNELGRALLHNERITN